MTILSARLFVQYVLSTSIYLLTRRRPIALNRVVNNAQANSRDAFNAARIGLPLVLAALECRSTKRDPF